MAEIKIEKKKKPIWPWVIFLLVVAALLWWLLAQDGPEPETFEQETEMVEPVSDQEMDDNAISNESEADTSPQDAVEEFQTFLSENEGEMGLEHKYTHQGITLMAAAMESANENLQNPADAEIKRLKQMADRIKVNTYAVTHADTIKAAFMMTSKTLQKMMTRNNMQPGTQIKELEKVAATISKEELATNQEKAVNRFFNKSAAIIEKIHQQSTSA